MLKGKILITGGSGFLGRGLLRRIRAENWPVDVTIYSRDETKQDELHRRYPEARCILGDVRDLSRLEPAVYGHDIIIHAAALKYIPEAERNVQECIDVNIQGSRNVVLAAQHGGVKQVVGLSTDKACLPVNIYGMTKAVMERMFAAANGSFPTVFTTVRYGNVVGSTGSVIPLFKRQLEDYGEVRVTDKSMTRFWLSIDEAIDLIVHALDNSSQEDSPQTFVYRCPAMWLLDLAELIADGAPVKITGLRPGEKLHERLVDYSESPRCRDDGPYCLLYPATASPVSDSEPWTYLSSAPAHWVNKDQMATMIEDAKGV